MLIIISKCIRFFFQKLLINPLNIHFTVSHLNSSVNRNNKYKPSTLRPLLKKSKHSQTQALTAHTLTIHTCMHVYGKVDPYIETTLSCTHASQTLTLTHTHTSKGEGVSSMFFSHHCISAHPSHVVACSRECVCVCVTVCVCVYIFVCDVYFVYVCR